MSRIIINGRFLIHRVTGVERYAHEIISELDKIVQPEEMVIAIPPDVTEVPQYQNIKVERVGSLKNRLWEHISFPLYAKKNDMLPLNLCNVAPLLYPGIVCIFDMKIKVHPDFFSKKFLFWYNILFFNSAKRAKLILTDSEAARKDILQYYPFVKPENVIVVYPSWQHFERIDYDENTLNKYNLNKQSFYFAMGSMEPNKNFKWIAKTAVENPEQTFVIAGSINATVFSNGLGFECPKNVKLLGYISDNEAKTLMRDCKAFLFPSIYEGFGLPPLEALSAGCKRVIVSDTEVMHEVFGNCVDYIPCMLENNNTTDNQMILNKYSWKESANRIYKLLNQEV